MCNLNQCTLYKGKSDTHDTYASHVSPHTPCVRFLWVVHVRGNLLHAINSVGRTLLHLRKRAPDTTPSPTEWCIGPPPSFSPKITIKAVMKAKHLLTTGYIDLLGLYHQHVISTFNTCSRGPTHRFLTDTNGGYSLEGTGFPHTTPRPSQSMISPFYLDALPDL
jgi:hypothetical protein